MDLGRGGIGLDEVQKAVETATAARGGMVVLCGAIFGAIVVVFRSDQTEEIVVFAIVLPVRSLAILRHRTVLVLDIAGWLEFRLRRQATVAVEDRVAERMTVLALRPRTLLAKMSKISAVEASCFVDSRHDWVVWSFRF